MSRLDSKTLVSLVWKNVLWLVVGLAVGLVGAFLYTRFLVTPTYTSSIQLYCISSPNSTYSGSVSASDINTSRMLVESYSIVLKSDEVLNQVAEKLGGDLTTGALRSMVSISSVNNTEIMQVTAVTKNARLSAEICKCIAEVAPKSLKRIMHVGAVEQIGTPSVPTAPSAPSYPRNVLLGGLLGVVIVVATVLLRYLLDNTVSDEQELRRRLSVPVLGEVPTFSGKNSYGKKYGYGYRRSK